MALRTYLAQHAWWGKLLGAGLGFLIAGPPGALFGVFIGNFFDRGLSDHFSKPHWSYHAEKRKAVKQAFQRATFSIMGHLAKIDGRVSEEEILFVKKTMRELQLNRTERTAAKAFFTQGKAETFQINEPLNLLKNITSNNTKLLRDFVQLQYRMAQTGGLTSKKVAALNNLLNLLNLAPLHEQAHARENFHTHFNQQHHWKDEGYSTAYGAAPPDNDAYILLNLSPDATQQEVKHAYRRQISLHHPDKYIAKGRSEADIKQANEKTQAVRKAYESICKQNDW